MPDSGFQKKLKLLKLRFLQGMLKEKINIYDESPANVDYILKHNPQIEKDIVEVCPNSIQVIDKSITKIMKDEIRNKYNIPIEKKVFVYGGNLGKPQDMPFRY